MLLSGVARSDTTIGTPPAADASCTATALNRTAPVQSDYSFTIFNLPGPGTFTFAQSGPQLPPPAFRVRATCSDGTVGETELVFPEVDSTVVYTGPIFWRPGTPIPVALTLAAASNQLSGHQTTQLTTTGILANAQTVDLTGRMRGTYYVPSVPSIVSVSDSGLATVTASVAPGSSRSVVIVAQNEGTAASTVLTIGNKGRLTGRVVKADGVSALGAAQVSVVRNQPRELVATISTDASGSYTLEDVSAGTFSISVTDPATGDMGRTDSAIANQGQTATANVVMNGQGTVTVNVVNGANSPVSNVPVTFTSLSAFRDVRALQTNAVGQVTFERALAGQFTVSTREAATNLLGAALGTVPAGGSTSVTLQLQAAGSIQGTVFAADGAAAQEGVQVRLVSAVRGIVTQSVTGASGAFSFDSLPLSDGPYTLDAMRDGRLRARVPNLVLTSGGQQLVRNVVFGPTGKVSGIVTRGSGTPVAGVTVNLQSQVGERFAFSTRTDADGRYSIDGVAVGAFSLTASGPLGEVASASGSISADGAVVAVNLQLSTNGLIGTVFARDGLTTVAGATVTLQPGNLTTQTNAQGQFGFTVSQPATYTIEAADGSGNRGRTQIVLTTINPSSPTVANVTFLGQGSVQGVVVDPLGALQPGAQVNLNSSGTFGGVYSATADAQGRYRFDHVFVGPFSVYARNVSTQLAGVSPGSLLGEGQVVTADITLAATGSVVGQVLRQDNVTPVPAARVELVLGNSTALTTTADASGRYSFGAVPLDDFKVVATALTDGDKGQASSRLTALNEVRTLNIRMVGQGTVRVRAVNSGGQAVSGAVLSLTSRSIFGTTQSRTTAADGTATFERVFNGDITVEATHGSGASRITGTEAATVVNGATLDLSITLSRQSVAALRGVVTSASGAQPVPGVDVRLTQVIPGAPPDVIAKTDSNGAYEFNSLIAGGNYRVSVSINGRIRAQSTLPPPADGEVLTRNLVLVGVGTVSGLVTNAQGAPVSGVRVTLTNSDPAYGGTWEQTTQSNGRYSLTEVAAGPFTLRARTTDGRQQGQGSGVVRFDADAVTLDVTLLNDSVTLPRTLYDGNAANFQVSGDGSLAGGVNETFAGDGSANTRAGRLDIVVNDVPVAFQNGDGSIGRRIEDGQVIEVDELNEASGLTVTRRVYVPKTGYFARHLELLENRTAAPITVAVRVTSSVSAGVGGARTVDSSSGDNVLSTASAANRDRWVVIDDDRDQDPFEGGNAGIATVALVFDGADAQQSAANASVASVGLANRVSWQWNTVTIAAGETAAFMHFTVQQLGRVAARAAAERLVLLPPEALEGLSTQERAAIRNFRVPADGLSTLQSLPPIEGSVVAGVVYAGDGVTTIGNADLTVRNTHPLFGRVYRTASQANGAYTIDSDYAGSGSAVSLLRDRVMVRATHPLTRELSPATEGVFQATSPTLQQNILFTGTGLLRGTVTRHTGVLVTNGEVRTAYAFPNGSSSMISVPIGSDGRYQFTGLAPRSYSLTALQLHAQAFDILNGIRGDLPGAVTVTPADVTLADIAMRDTGEVTGVVRNASNEPVVGATVRLEVSQVYRSTTTDTGGRYRFTDVAVGTYDVRATGSSGLTASAPVSATRDVSSIVDLRLSGLGVLTVQVNYQRGAPAAGASVIWVGREYHTANGAGVTTFSVPLDQSVNIQATHPDNGNLQMQRSIAVPASTGTQTLTLTLPGAGAVGGTVLRPDGSTLAPNVRVSLRRLDGSGTARITDTDQLGQYHFYGVPLGEYTLTAQDQSSPRYADALVSVITDGAELTFDLTLGDNIIPLPASLYDANGFEFDVLGAGLIGGGWDRDSNVFSNGAVQLQVNGQAFTGNTSALLEAGRRQFAITQAANIAGLHVTRKVFVPHGSYFARYLEVLENPGATPITASVVLTTRYSGNSSDIIATSTGDTLLQAAEGERDTWFVLDDSVDSDPFLLGSRPPTAFAVGSGNAAINHDLLTRATSSGVPIQTGWSAVTVPAGGRVVLMHFVVQQVSRAGAIASVDRLQQLPPEALQWLTPEEIAAVANFALPADGVSTVAPLPSLTGRISGNVYEGDGTTPVPNTKIQLRSTHPLFGRTWRPYDYTGFGCEGSDTSSLRAQWPAGNYSLNGHLADRYSVPLPVGFDVQLSTMDEATCNSFYNNGHPLTGVPAPVSTVHIDPQSGSATHNVVFETGILTGTVIGPSDYSVVGGQVRTSVPQGNNVVVSIGSDGTYRLPGLPTNTYVLDVDVPHNQGTELTGRMSDAVATAGQTTIVDIQLQPTGSVTGSVVTPNGETSPNSLATLQVNGSDRWISRSTHTDSLGRYNFSAVPVGEYTLSVVDARTYAVTTSTVVVTANQVTTHNVTLVGTGVVRVTVRFARGAPAPDAQIQLRAEAAGVNFNVLGRTNAQGQFDALVPVGTYTIRTRHPADQFDSLDTRRDVVGTMSANNEQQSKTIDLPSLAGVRVSVVDQDNGNAPIANATVEITHAACTRCSRGSTDASGRLLIAQVPEGSYSVVVRTTAGRSAQVSGVINAAVDGQIVDKTVAITSQMDRLGVLSFGTERQLYSVPVNTGDVISLSINGAVVNGTASSYITRAEVYDTLKTRRARGYGYDIRNGFAQYNESGDLRNVVVQSGGMYTLAISPYYTDGRYLGGYRLEVKVNGVDVAIQPYQNGGAVTGIVVRPDGSTPAAGQLVELGTYEQLQLTLRTLTGADGRFEFTGVPVGGYSLAVRDAPTNRTVIGVYGNVQGPSDTQTHTLQLPPRTTLQVQVEIRGGLAVPATLTFQTSDDTGFNNAGTVTFPSGSRVSNVATAYAYGQSVVVRVAHPNNFAVVASARVDGVDGQTVPVSLVLATASLSGRVTTATSAPASNVYVKARLAADGSYVGSTYTDSEGRYTFSVLPAGALMIGATNDASNAVTYRSITLGGGDSGTVDLQLSGLGTLVGLVRTTQGVPLPDVEMRIEYQHDELDPYRWTRYVNTDAAGEYRLTDMPVGRELTARAEFRNGFTNVSAQGTATIAQNGGEARVDLELPVPAASVAVRAAAADGRAISGSCRFTLAIDGRVDEGEGGWLGVVTQYAPCATGAVFQGVPAGGASVDVRLFDEQSESESDLGTARLTVVAGQRTDVVVWQSVVSGTIRFADGSPVTDASVILITENENVLYPDRQTATGEYSFIGVPIGDFRVEAQDNVSGLSSIVSGTLLEPSAPVQLDIVMGLSGSVGGTFLTTDGMPIEEADVYIRSSALAVDLYASTDENGEFLIDVVAAGEITIRVKDPDTGLVTVSTGTLIPGGQLRMELRSADSVSISGRVLGQNGTTPIADARVVATTAVSHGPFGVLNLEVVTDSNGAYSFEGLPLGEIILTAAIDELMTSRRLQLTASGTVDLQFPEQVTMIEPTLTLSGADTSLYDVTCDGSLGRGGYSGTYDAYDYAYVLDVNRSPFPCVRFADTAMSGREVALGAYIVEGLRVSRRVYVPEAGGFARYLEVLNNPTSQPITVPVTLYGWLASYDRTGITTHPSQTGNRYATTTGNIYNPELGHVFAGNSAPVAGNFLFTEGRNGGGYLRYRWTLTVPPNGTVSLLHFAVQRGHGDVAGAKAQAEALANGTQPGMFDGLNSEERNSLQNFVVTQ